MLATVREIQFAQHGDKRGKLLVLESLTELVPFDIKRVYYIFDTTAGMVRGIKDSMA